MRLSGCVCGAPACHACLLRQQVSYSEWSMHGLPPMKRRQHADTPSSLIKDQLQPARRRGRRHAIARWQAGASSTSFSSLSSSRFTSGSTRACRQAALAPVPRASVQRGGQKASTDRAPALSDAAQVARGFRWHTEFDRAFRGRPGPCTPPWPEQTRSALCGPKASGACSETGERH